MIPRSRRASRASKDALVNVAGSPPEASSVNITGTPTAGQTLTGHYTYSDPDGDPEGTSTFRWLRGGVAIGGATAITYVLVVADIGAVITFEVTPVSSVAPTTGTPVVSAGTAAVSGRAPTASSVSITGTPHVGQLLTGSYTFADADGDSEGTSTFRWLRSGVAIGGATSIQYTLQSADRGATIRFEVTPVSVAAPTTGSAVQSSATATIVGVPTASGVSISGTPTVGETLTGNYTYADLDGDPEGTSTFRWLRDGVAIGGATSETYELVEDDEGADISFEVTPVSTQAPTTGTPVVSSEVGPVEAAVGPGDFYYDGPGASGDVLMPSTTLAATILFPGTTESPFTIAGWCEVTDTHDDERTLVNCYDLPSFFPVLRLAASDPDGANDSGIVVNDGTNSDFEIGLSYPAGWNRHAITFDGTSIRYLRNGVLLATLTGSPGALAWPNAADTLVFFASTDEDGDAVVGKWRNIMINDRQHSTAEELGLTGAGMRHDPLEAATDWSGGQSIPVIWNTEDVAGAVPNRGDGGTCNLVLHGACTSVLDP